MRYEDLIEYLITQTGTLLFITMRDITSLPPEIGQLTHLKGLHLWRNKLTSLPPEIGQLTNLVALYAYHNDLMTLPPEIGELNQLKFLDLSNNRLTELPKEVGKLTNLKELILKGNQIKSLPAEIGLLKSLKILNLQDNPLPLPPEILQKIDTPEAIITFYLKNVLSTDAKKPLNEAKVLIVGQGAVGKTSLLNKLTTNIFDPNMTKTEGIDIHRWKLRVNGDEFQLNIWDFGGQEIMHATHQFFLTKRSIYLLVLNSRQTEQENRVDYWLKLIKSFGGDSPVIVVCNRCDEQEMEMNWRGLKEKYQNIKSIVRRVSCKTGEGILELQRCIENEIRSLQHPHNELHNTWFSVKNELAAMEESKIDFIPYSRYQEICKAHGVAGIQDQKILIGFLHDLGIVLHFLDHPLLDDTNVLNPEWVTKGVYAIINNPSLTKQKGVLELKDLETILNQKRYPKHTHLFIVEMMRKFEMCYDFEGFVNKKFLISVKLPLEPPELERWGDALRFQYRYGVLPESIITRFMVRMHAYIDGNTYWRHGVQLKSERGENQALVKADMEERKITIEVTGDKRGRRDLLKIIRSDFYKIHNSFSGLNIMEKIPLSESPEILVDYNHLLYLEKNKIESYMPEGCFFKISVKHLLDGIEPEEDRRQKSIFEYQPLKEVVMGDQYIVSGQAGTIGPGAQVQSIEFQQVWNQIQTQVDLTVLTKELEKLKGELKREAETEEQFEAVKNVAAAEREAKANNGPKMLKYLKQSGVWVFETATQIGTTLAAELIKKTMGL